CPKLSKHRVDRGRTRDHYLGSGRFGQQLTLAEEENQKVIGDSEILVNGRVQANTRLNRWLLSRLLLQFALHDGKDDLQRIGVGLPQRVVSDRLAVALVPIERLVRGLGMRATDVLVGLEHQRLRTAGRYR